MYSARVSPINKYSPYKGPINQQAPLSRVSSRLCRPTPNPSSFNQKLQTTQSLKHSTELLLREYKFTRHYPNVYPACKQQIPVSIHIQYIYLCTYQDYSASDSFPYESKYQYRKILCSLTENYYQSIMVWAKYSLLRYFDPSGLEILNRSHVGI